MVSEHIANAKEGLPLEVFYFVSTLTPLINVDLLIENEKGQILLTWRDDKFYGSGWHIPGGIIRFKEKIEDRIEKVAFLELGTSVKFLSQPIHIRGAMNKDRDVRGHFISLLFLCELTGSLINEKSYNADAPQVGQWAWHDKAPANLIKAQESFRQYINGARPPWVREYKVIVKN
jgi:colanic acid biosynthesis protein WcaH